MCNIICQLEPEKGQPLSVPPFVKLISRFSFTWPLTTTFRQQWAFTKAASRLFLSIAISEQLYMQRLTWLCARSYYYGNDRGFWFGNETPCARAYKSWKKWRPSQRIEARVCCEQLLKVELELRRNQWSGKILVEVWIHFVLQPCEYLSHSRDIFVEERIRKMAFLLPHTFVFSCLPQGFWESILVLLIIEALKEEGCVVK